MHVKALTLADEGTTVWQLEKSGRGERRGCAPSSASVAPSSAPPAIALGIVVVNPSGPIARMSRPGRAFSHWPSGLTRGSSVSRTGRRVVGSKMEAEPWNDDQQTERGRVSQRCTLSMS